MTTPKPGHLVAFVNADKTSDNKRPAFVGDFELPGETEKRALALWPHTSKETGQTYFTGRAALAATEQIDALAANTPDKGEPTLAEAQTNGQQLAVDAGDVVLFTNKQRSADNPNRPTYYGYINPGNGRPLHKISVWAKTTKQGKPMLSGSVLPHVTEPEPALDLNQELDQQRSRRRGR